MARTLAVLRQPAPAELRGNVYPVKGRAGPPDPGPAPDVTSRFARRDNTAGVRVGSGSVTREVSGLLPLACHSTQDDRQDWALQGGLRALPELPIRTRSHLLDVRDATADQKVGDSSSSECAEPNVQGIVELPTVQRATRSGADANCLVFDAAICARTPPTRYVWTSSPECWWISWTLDSSERRHRRRQSG
jgi:hypothetical protein